MNFSFLFFSQPNVRDEDDDRSESPPMPSIPPPAPPPELFTATDSVSSGMENLSISGNKAQGSQCIALYDYESSHPDDLTFKVCNLSIFRDHNVFSFKLIITEKALFLLLQEGTVIEIVEGTSGEWLRGRINDKEGMFPASFVDVAVPSSDTGGVFVTALYSFAPETWEDLELQVSNLTN